MSGNVNASALQGPHHSAENLTAKIPEDKMSSDNVSSFFTAMI
jgi:hypothetical protein